MKFKNLRNWHYKPISSITETITDYVANGSFATLKENTEYVASSKFILIRLVDYNNNFNGEFKYITKESYEFLDKTKLFGGEIIISNVGANAGTVFKTPYLKYKMSLGPNSIVVKTKENDDFYYYWFKSIYGQFSLDSIKTGSAQPKFNKTDFRKLLVPVPDILEQNRIANILNNLDGKIEVNNKIIANLEEQAQAIFKSWFVDFEPFQDGNFVESELGMIPEGWEVEELKNITECKLGGTPSRKIKNYWNGSIGWINSGEVNKDRIIDPTEYITKEGLENSATKLLNKKTTLIAITGATLGQVSLLEIDCCTNQSIIGIEQNNDLPYEYLYLFIKNNIFKIISNQTGAAQQHINLNDMKTTKIILPTKDIMMKYKSITAAFFEKIEKLYFQNKKLAEIRDALLPRLMSGEIDVSDIKIKGEEVKNE